MKILIHNVDNLSCPVSHALQLYLNCNDIDYYSFTSQDYSIDRIVLDSEFRIICTPKQLTGITCAMRDYEKEYTLEVMENA